MRTRLTPLVVIVASALVTAAIIAGELILLAKFDSQAAAFGLPQISTAMMPDGTVLTLHAVSIGKRHSLNFPIFEPSIRLRAQPAANIRALNYPTNVDRVVFIVSRHDPETDEFLDIDWWSHCIVKDAHGSNVTNVRSQRSVHSKTANASQWSNQHPPFRPLDRQLVQAENKRILLAIELPVFRTAASNSLSFFNQKNEEVATLLFTRSWPVPAAEWTPQTLPVTASAGEMSLVVNEFQLKAHERTDNERVEDPRWQLESQVELLENGQPAEHWSYGIQTVSDVLSNEVSPWNVTLSRNEPAWRVRFQATRLVDAKFSADERLTMTGIQVLKDNTFDVDLTTLKEQSVDLVPIALAGVGDQGFHVPGLVGGRRSHSSGGSVPIATSNLDFAKYRLKWSNTGGYPGEHLQLETQAPCLILENAGLPQGTQVLVRTRDARGREIRSHIRPFYDFAYLVFFDAKPDVGELTCEFLLQTPLEFDVLIAPPRPDPASR